MRLLLARISILDVLTAGVLVVAVVLFVRPGSALNASVTRSMELRRMQSAAERNWEELVTVAVPLYEGGAEPEIIEFSDYECPFCRSASLSVDSALAMGVRVALVHFPLGIHANAKPAALAAICARQIGRFQEVHRLLMTTNAWQSDPAWAKLPGFADIVLSPEFDSCLADPDTETRLRKHRALADSLHITATPRFVGRSRVLDEPPTLDNLITLSRGQ
jgi:protein-disulfide isomerase